MSEISYPFAFLLGAFLECVMYGIFFVLLIAACYVQWEKFSKRRGVNRIMVFTTVFFGLTVTTDCVLSLYRAVRAIFYLPPGVTLSKFLSPPLPTEEIVRVAVLQFQIVVGDIVMAYRMYHIYDKNPFVCVIPSLTIAALFAVACNVTHQLQDLTTPQKLKAMSNWSSVCYCLTIFNSLFMTVAISFRLWCVHRETASANIQVKDSIILRAMKALIEGAALWTTFVAINFFLFLAGNNLEYTSLAMTGPAVGISFCLIIVRLGHILPEAREESWHMSVRIPGSRTPGSDQVGGSFAQIKVQRDVFASDSTDFRVETLESQKHGRVDPPDDVSKVIRASLNLPTAL
ncbi:hypothetical protein BDM02DRAFT_3270923 [Thelephora ganbajun]|uniref:Uncharacterized protein n=1 Tax=Thelephora ganbajun TaxID=370292 RepID=A0ACB6Z9T1_THEGA|nr:hypothetical protein BDM02DRAFT_3270923 [Thelephora ganbajun]